MMSLVFFLLCCWPFTAVKERAASNGREEGRIVIKTGWGVFFSLTILSLIVRFYNFNQEHFPGNVRLSGFFSNLSWHWFLQNSFSILCFASMKSWTKTNGIIQSYAESKNMGFYLSPSSLHSSFFYVIFKSIHSMLRFYCLFLSS